MSNAVLEEKADRFNFEGFEDFRFIDEFEEEGDTVAVVSHPGWGVFYYTADDFLRGPLQGWLEENEIQENRGLFRAFESSLSFINDSENYLIGRQAIYEIELFLFLEQRGIPTIVTVPFRPCDVDEEKIMAFYREHKGKPFDDIPETFLDLEGRFVLSSCMSSHLVEYLRDIRGERENFYILPSWYYPGIEEKRAASGFILDSDGYGELDHGNVREFLESVEGRRVLFGGSDLDGCVDSTLGYFRFVDCDVRVLLNYCGLSKDAKKDGEFEGISEVDEVVIERIEDLIEKIRGHPQEKCVTKKMKDIFDACNGKIEERIMKSPYLFEGISRINGFSGYVTDLESF